MSRASLQTFTEVKDAVSATPGKLAKQAALAEYFKSLAEEDLRLAVHCAAGRAFRATDQRVLAVGGARVVEIYQSEANTSRGGEHIEEREPTLFDHLI